MGAYYTKEDITGYICRNTIIPRLFDMLAEVSDVKPPNPMPANPTVQQGYAGLTKFRKSVSPLPIGPHPNLMNEGLGMSEAKASTATSIRASSKTRSFQRKPVRAKAKTPAI